MSAGNLYINPLELIEKAKVIEGQTVADLGCGSSGHFIVPIAKLVGKNGKVYAVDIQKPVLSSIVSVAKMNLLTNIETVWSNLEIVGAAKIPDNSVDIAILINILFQNKKRLEIIKEATRLLKSGGRLILADWHKFATPVGPPVASRVDKEEIKKMAETAGLVLLEDAKLGNNHFLLIFQK